MEINDDREDMMDTQINCVIENQSATIPERQSFCKNFV